jgi:hypothetical protein
MAKTKSNKTRKVIARARLSLKKMVTDAKQPAAIIGGMIVGKLAADLLDKGFNAAATKVSGLNGTVKSVAKPVIITGAGLAAMQMLKNPLLRNMGIGIAAFGGATAITEAFNLPVFEKITGGSKTYTALPPSTATTSGLGDPANAPYGFRNEIAPAKRLQPASLPRLNVL